MLTERRFFIAKPDAKKQTIYSEKHGCFLPNSIKQLEKLVKMLILPDDWSVYIASVPYATLVI